ncbi:hypothetical protein ACWEKM_42210 [Streptomyces sp. NPDC004752]
MSERAVGTAARADTVRNARTTPHREDRYPVGAVGASEPALTDGDFTDCTDNNGFLPVSCPSAWAGPARSSPARGLDQIKD